MIHNKLWEELESETSGIYGQGTLKRMVGKNIRYPMFFGIQQPDWKRTFILQVPKDKAPLKEDIVPSNGFDFKVMIVGDETKKEYVSLIVTVSNADYNEIFSSIADDLYVKLNTLVNINQIISTFLSRVKLWQKFFEKQSAEGLSENAQKGLFGELYFLDNFVLTGHSFERLLRCWIGSERHQHDFQFGDFSVEVKTTSSKKHQKLQIASEQQLDETSVNKLYLFFLSLSYIQNNKNTLPKLIKNIRNKLELDPVSLDLFNNALLARGYLDTQRSKYNNKGYTIRNFGFLIVKDMFPRIKETDLRLGVGDVEYSISLDTCKGYQVPESDFFKDLSDITQ